MPLYNKKPVERISPPVNLLPNEKVFYVEATNEVFTNYDDFFNRQILLNSTQWTCAMTGKGSLTYFEALESEKEAEKQLVSFPQFFRMPILFIVQKYTNRGRLEDVVNDVVAFVKDRYFVGEDLIFQDGRKKTTARVTSVRLQLGGEQGTAKVKTSGGKTNPIDIGLPPVEAYRYDLKVVRQEAASSEEEGEDHDDGIRKDVHPCNMSRKRDSASKIIIRLLLKKSLHLGETRQLVKAELVDQYKLAEQSWAKDVYGGPEPKFPETPLQQRGRPNKMMMAMNVARAVSLALKGGPRVHGTLEEKKEPISPSKDESKPETSREEKPKRKRSRKKKEEGAGEKEKNKPADKEKSPTKKIGERKRKEIEAQQNELLSSFEVAKRLDVPNLTKWQQNERLLTPKEMETLRECIKEARVKRREVTREEKRKEKEAYAEWRKPRDDLLCDDLKVLPEYSRLPLPDWMSEAELADYLTIHHFFISFQDILPVKEIHGSSRITFSDVVIAIRCRDPSRSTLADLFRILLQAKQDRAEEEDGDEANLNRRDEMEGQGADVENPLHGEAIRERTIFHERLRDTFGNSIRNLHVDWLTMSEVLRLHLLTSGYYTGVATVRHRQHQRGGVKCYEDAGYQFCETHPDVLVKLETGTVFDLSSQERTDLLKMLMDQLLSYSKFRAHQEERLALLIEQRKELKMLRNWMAAQEKDARDAVLTIEFIKDTGNDEQIEKPKPSAETLKLCGHLKALREGRRTDRADLEQLVLAGIAYNELAEEEVSQAREVQREFYQKNEQMVLDYIHDLEAVSCFVYLGSDRANRLYFMLDAIPAIVVEETLKIEGRERAGSCEQPTPVADSSGWANDESRARVALLGCTADEECPVHGKRAESRPRWNFIDKTEKFKQLISSLNPRGIREVELLEELTSRESRLLDITQRCEAKRESGQLEAAFMVGKEDPGSLDCELDWQREMREIIAELEEKMYTGQIGSLPEVINRQEWRRLLLEEGDVTPIVKAAGLEMVLSMDGEEEGEVLWSREQMEDLTQVQRLALALLQLIQSIKPKFFKDPFILEGKNNTDPEPSDVLLNWQRELTLSARSISALSLYLYSIERYILWNLSKLQAKCRICRKKGSPESLTLCIECRQCYHNMCVKPALPSSPQDWLCSECVAVRKREATKAKRAAAREAAIRNRNVALEEAESNGRDTEEDGTEGRNEGDTHDRLEENGGSAQAMKTSSGRIVKKVFYNENVLAPPVKNTSRKSARSGTGSSSSRRARERENSWEEEEEETAPSKRRRRDDDYDVPLRSLSIGLRETSRNFKEKLQESEKAIRETMNQPFAEPFALPVDSRRIGRSVMELMLKVPDYPLIIKNPMDLRTIINKIKQHVYDSISEVKADAELIIANCKLYNKEGSELTEMAEEMGEFLLPRIEKIMSDDGQRR